MSGLAGKNALIRVISGASVAFTDQALTVAADQKTCYIGDGSTYAVWDDTQALTIDTSPDGVTWTTAAADTYTAQWPIGTVVFGTALAGGTHVRASGYYWPTSVLAGGNEWSMEIDQTMLDDTTFASGGVTWKSQTPGLLSGKVTMKRFYVDDYFLTYLGTKMVGVFYVDEPNHIRYAGYCYLSKNTIQAAIEKMIDETGEAEFTQPLYYATV